MFGAWVAGDPDAGERLFERHFDAVARFFRNKVDRGHEDLIQKTFLGCVEARARFRGDASFRTFLFAVARNVLGKHYRAKRRAPIELREVSVHDLGASPSVVFARDQQQLLLLNALRRIPVEYQVALELHYWEAMSGSEIAAVLEVPLGTAKTRIRRAKQLLAAEYEELLSGASSPQATQTRLDTWARSLRAQLFSE
ncbi:MAG: RNA polymerase sigma factor [Myxococcales bacterium]|nr:RNA polymerase sigma factor [Myxococcales bacterium]